MANAQENPSFTEENDIPPEVEEEQGILSLSRSVEPKDLQAYWRWVQLDILRGRGGKSSL